MLTAATTSYYLSNLDLEQVETKSFDDVLRSVPGSFSVYLC